ncbi:hypothetical protein [Streptomyces sp. NPDC050534]|uniref:hypothetical protein n=1 Tax=Streptomyces sp. NPDC050534 TaxID=3365625 RepID=UPI00379253AB
MPNCRYHGPGRATIAIRPSFHTGSLLSQEGLDAAVGGMPDQVLAWSGALRGVREAKKQTATAA